MQAKVIRVVLAVISVGMISYADPPVVVAPPVSVRPPSPISIIRTVETLATNITSVTAGYCYTHWDRGTPSKRYYWHPSAPKEQHYEVAATPHEIVWRQGQLVATNTAYFIPGGNFAGRLSGDALSRLAADADATVGYIWAFCDTMLVDWDFQTFTDFDELWPPPAGVNK